MYHENQILIITSWITTPDEISDIPEDPDTLFDRLKSWAVGLMHHHVHGQPNLRLYGNWRPPIENIDIDHPINLR